ncbi:MULTISPECIES: ParB/RepB/Spo0J family partition protein [unclassified Ornithinimicrobium]|uniref:ParB/RepB/Spo0J family partition protein n=1 Tax=unclassified Ornithinimicrobium TaxID=2615080 RepID=UPI003854FC4D
MSERRRGLGKGLGALIPTAAPGGDRPSDVFFPRAVPTDGFTGNGPRGTWGADDAATEGVHAKPGSSFFPGPDGDGVTLAPVPGAQYAEIPIDSIRANPRQPRQVFDEDDLAELVASIREVGVLQPIVVRPVTDSSDEEVFELVMGERRLRATREAGRTSIPAIVRLTEDQHMLRDALLENLHRAQLNPLEEAAAYQQLLDDFGCTHEELAGRVGRSRPQISNTLRLLRLPPLVQRRLASGVLTAGHARALLGLGDGAAMERLAQRIVAEGLSVRSVEEIVVLGGDTAPSPRRAAQRSAPTPEMQQAAESLSARLETRVQVVMGRRKGKITVDFAGPDDLERILAALAHD